MITIRVRYDRMNCHNVTINYRVKGLTKGDPELCPHVDEISKSITSYLFTLHWLEGVTGLLTILDRGDLNATVTPHHGHQWNCLTTDNTVSSQLYQTLSNYTARPSITALTPLWHVTTLTETGQGWSEERGLFSVVNSLIGQTGLDWCCQNVWMSGQAWHVGP